MVHSYLSSRLPLSTGGSLTVEDVLRRLAELYPDGVLGSPSTRNEALGRFWAMYPVSGDWDLTLSRLKKDRLVVPTRPPRGTKTREWIHSVDVGALNLATEQPAAMRRSVRVECQALIDTFVTLAGYGALEKTIILHEGFRERMETLKRVDPNRYEQLGGCYLDRLLADSDG